MTTVTAPFDSVTIKFPTRKEWQALMAHPSVIITMIVCVAVVALGAIAGVVYLASTGHDTAVVGTLIVVVLAAVGGLLNARLRQTRDAAQGIQQNVQQAIQKGQE